MTGFSFLPMNNSEFRSWVQSLQFLVGARLQQAFWNETGMKFHFYNRGQDYMLICDLQQAKPFAYIEAQGAKKGSAHKPILLFLKSHFYGQVLEAVEHVETEGRQCRLIFKSGEIELCLVPHAVNVYAHTDKSGIHFRKPIELAADAQEYQKEARTLESILSSYLAGQSSKTSSKVSDSTSIQSPSPTKLQKLKVKLEAEIDAKLKFDFVPFQRLAEKIQISGMSDLEAKEREILKGYDDKKSALSYLYSLSRKNKIKLDGVRKRLSEISQQLEAEAKAFKDAGSRDNSLHNHQGAAANKGNKNQKERNLLIQSQAKGRTLKLTDAAYYVGKSASDNLALLRKAQAHDLWIHLRDYPSSHGILRVNKGQKVSLSDLILCAQFLVKNTFHNDKWVSITSTKFDVIYAECRHVRPIKGGALGTVTYRNEKSFVLTFDPTQV